MKFTIEHKVETKGWNAKQKWIAVLTFLLSMKVPKFENHWEKQWEATYNHTEASSQSWTVWVQILLHHALAVWS